MLESTWGLIPSVLALIAAGAVVLLAGSRITRIADELADRTGLGESIAGAVLLGAVTSLSGMVTLIIGGLEGDAGFALSNPLGGIALQTVWLAIADLLYRRANLEHAAASMQNVLQAVLLMGLLAIPVVGYATPDVAIWGVHPVSFAIPVAYVAGLSLVGQMQRHPMWWAKRTPFTRRDVPQPGTDASDRRLWTQFGLLALVLACGGFLSGEAGLGIVAATGLSGNLVGATLTTATSSLAELVTLVAAVRMGALTLGVGTVIGGNLFDLLQVTVADIAYRPGPVYAAAGPAGLALTAGCMLITAVLAGGLLVRNERGIGFEGWAIPTLWVGTIGLVAVL